MDASKFSKSEGVSISRRADAKRNALKSRSRQAIR